MKTITFTAETLAEFKRLKAEAEAQGKDSFVFQGGEVLCAYAKYVIEYVESRIGK